MIFRNLHVLYVLIVLSFVWSTLNVHLMVMFDFRSNDAVEYENIGGAKDSQIFRREDLDLDREVYCGFFKCLFQTNTVVKISGRETRNDGARPKCAAGQTIEYQTGYLIGKTNEMDEAILDGWKIAQYLEAKFGIKHFFLEPPIQVNVKDFPLVPIFLSILKGAERESYIQRLEFVGAGATTVVQKVAVAPNTFQKIKVIVDFLENEHVYATENKILASMEALLDASIAERGIPDARVEARECGFFSQLDIEMTRLIELLHHEPLMALDFQFILDTSGNLYHIDLDRVVNFPNQHTLKPFNQTNFDANLRSMLDKSLRITTIIRQWIHTKQQQDWEDEENMILAATNLPCLATERVAIGGRKTTSAMKGILRYPLQIALLQRMIMDGAYGGANVTSWDCNVFGDRVG